MMTQGIPHRLAIFLLCLSLALSALGGPPSAALALTVEEEKKLGREFMLQIGKQVEILNDDFTGDCVNALGQYLLGSLEVRYFPFRFYLVKDSRLNAFAAPAGHIFVFSGLIREMEEIDELAAVICHEIAHVSARHLAQRIDQNKMIGLATMAGVLAGAFIGGKAAGAVMAGSVAAGIQAQLHYSRNDERQADQLGFEYMNRAGFDPAAMITVLNKIQRAETFDASKIPAYLLTHPTGPERMANLDSLVSGHRAGAERKEAAGFSAMYPFFRTALSALTLPAEEVRTSFERRLRKDPGSVQAYFGLGVLLKEGAEYDLSAEHLEEALRRTPGSLPVQRYLAEVYQLEGEHGRAVALYEKILAADDRNRWAVSGLAGSYLEMGEYARAVALYEKLLSLEPEKEETLHRLGMAYGKEGKLALAHYYFGRYFQRTGDAGKAAFHLRKALELSGGDAALEDRIRRAMEGTP